jgi:hypothetical protein
MPRHVAGSALTTLLLARPTSAVPILPNGHGGATLVLTMPL